MDHIFSKETRRRTFKRFKTAIISEDGNATVMYNTNLDSGTVRTVETLERTLIPKEDGGTKKSVVADGSLFLGTRNASDCIETA